MDKKTGYAANYYTETFRDADTTEKTVRDYPISSVARFLFLYHLKKNNDSRFQEVAKQTGIYLQNPLWANLQLSQAQKEIEIETRPELPVVENKFNEEKVALAVNEEKTENFISEPEENVSVEAGKEIIEPGSVREELPEEVNREKKENFIPEPEESALVEPGNEIIGPRQIEKDLPAEVNEEKKENFVSDPEGSETSQEIVSEKNEDAVLNQQVVEVPEVQQVKNENIQQQPSPATETDLNEKEPVIPDQENEDFEKNEPASQIKLPAENESESGEDEDEPISFEPLHTVDYFASQGIRLSQEALNNDQLGKQVKSFTAWLKSMKKLHPGHLPEQNEVIEKLIQTSSEASNQNANVLTEAMAEVLVKQGKQEKAIEMYQKLSLINPSKSAYFAAKIESLKTV